MTESRFDPQEDAGGRMKQNEIIEMARQIELNLYVHDLTEKQYIEVLKHFGKLVAAEEREACAKVADEHGFYGVSIAQDIRARGEA